MPPPVRQAALSLGRRGLGPVMRILNRNSNSAPSLNVAQHQAKHLSLLIRSLTSERSAWHSQPTCVGRHSSRTRSPVRAQAAGLATESSAGLPPSAGNGSGGGSHDGSGNWQGQDGDQPRQEAPQPGASTAAAAEDVVILDVGGAIDNGESEFNCLALRRKQPSAGVYVQECTAAVA